MYIRMLRHMEGIKGGRDECLENHADFDHLQQYLFVFPPQVPFMQKLNLDYA